MKFVFWQNVVSIHQSAFIKALAANNDVTLVAEKSIDDKRRREKWIVPSMGNATVIVAPSDEEIFSLLEKADTHHVFSGINAYPMVYKVFKKSVKLGLQVSVMAEPYEWAGMKGKLRQLMYRWLFLRYGKHINHLFATGDMGVRCYKKSGFPEHKIHQWGYFTEQVPCNEMNDSQRELPNLIFIGKIDNRKNILSLAQCAINFQDKFNHFTIIGTGPLESELRKIISDVSNIEFIGPIANCEVATYLANSDLLILPSLFDGWGAVVNEALSQGARVLCSDRCGAKTLLDGKVRGGVFSLKDKMSLDRELEYWIKKGPLSSSIRKEIISWAKDNISGESVSKYFSDIMATSQEVAPWITPPPLVNKR